jgi:hypothetical protein
MASAIDCADDSYLFAADLYLTGAGEGDIATGIDDDLAAIPFNG